MFRWNDKATAASLTDLTSGVERMFAGMPYVLEHRFSLGAGIEEGAYDAVLVADFAGREDFARYRVDPDHAQLSSQLVAPILSDHAAIQFEV